MRKSVHPTEIFTLFSNRNKRIYSHECNNPWGRNLRGYSELTDNYMKKQAIIFQRNFVKILLRFHIYLFKLTSTLTAENSTWIRFNILFIKYVT